MKVISTVVLSIMIFVSPYLSSMAHAQFGCIHSGDAGRWTDNDDPATRLADMCARHYTTYQAQNGRMVIQNMNTNDCNNAIGFAKNQQSWHGDWFLWNEITCGNMKVYIQ